MKNYTVNFKYSTDGNYWIGTSIIIKAESDMGAISQVSSRYKYIKDIRIVKVK